MSEHDRVMIGIDPHKHSHTAVAITGSEEVMAEKRFQADRRQIDSLLSWSDGWPSRVWAIEGAYGLGRLLAQQLVAAGETVIDVPATLTSRVRLLDRGHADKTDPADAYAAAVAGLRTKQPRYVELEDHSAVLRMLAARRKNLVESRVKCLNRLHSQLCHLKPGGAPKRFLTAKRAALILRSIRPLTAVETERKIQANELVADVRRLDRDLGAVEERIKTAVTESGTSLTELDGIGYIGAATIIGHTGNIARFASKERYASYNGTAPIEASSGDRKRHRLNRGGNRQINQVLYIMAISQVQHRKDGYTYYETKLGQGKSPKEARRALKRHLSNVVYRTLVADAEQSSTPLAA